jgi:hypothetical protein
MTIAELNLIAGGYNISVKKIDSGVYLIDFKTSRYFKMCESWESKTVTKERLIQNIRKFADKLHNR